MMIYKVIQAASLRELEAKVSHLLNDGWICSGSIYCMERQWVQPMITDRTKHKEKPSKALDAAEGMKRVDELT